MYYYKMRAYQSESIIIIIMVSWLTKNPLVRTQEKWIGANRICERNDKKNLTLEEK